MYPRLGDALKCFTGNIRCFNTNGKLLMEKASEIIGNLETLTISVVEGDEEQEEQYEIVKKFVRKRKNRIPAVIGRLLGECPNPERWGRICEVTTGRVLHSPTGSFEYSKKVTIPEIGICLDLLTHLAIDRYGNISMCVRFDPGGELRLGNIKDMTLQQAWNSEKRRFYLEKHIGQNRAELSGCSKCEYWGVATSP